MQELVEVARHIIAEGRSGLETPAAVQRERGVEGWPAAGLEAESPQPAIAGNVDHMFEQRRRHALAQVVGMGAHRLQLPGLGIELAQRSHAGDRIAKPCAPDGHVRPLQPGQVEREDVAGGAVLMHRGQVEREQVAGRLRGQVVGSDHQHLASVPDGRFCAKSPGDDDGRSMGGLIPVAEAQARLLALARPAAPIAVPLAEATGRWAAADICARVDHPFADVSAMDGYAIRFADRPGPWRIVGEVAAGAPPGLVIGAGEAARIFTGAPVPAGADAILVQEEAARDGDVMRMAGESPPRAGAHIRRRGFNFAAGDVVIPMGARLTAARIGLAAMAGHGALPVRPRVRVALLSTGDELAAPGTELGPGQIYASNAPLLQALLADLPVDLVDHGLVPDRLDRLTEALSDAAGQADIVVTSGGASVGDHDLVRPALIAAGATLDFWKIAMRPGKPLMAGRIGTTVALGLPGNPVSAFVTAFLFLRPLVAAFGGAADPLPPIIRLPLAAPVGANGPRADYMRALLGPDGVRALTSQDSAALGTLAAADALIVRPPHASAADAGEMVDVHMLA